jgi:hypothetical protein
MRIHPLVVLFAAGTLMAGCHKAAPKTVTLGGAFRTIPLPPNAQALANEGGVDAMQFLFVTPDLPDSVLAYYRRIFTADPFHLVNERTHGATTALYAEQDNGPPIWVTISANGSEGSQVTIAGAKDANYPDSAGKLTTADSGATTSLPVKKP